VTGKRSRDGTPKAEATGIDATPTPVAQGAGDNIPGTNKKAVIKKIASPPHPVVSTDPAKVAQKLRIKVFHSQSIRVALKARVALSLQVHVIRPEILTSTSKSAVAAGTLACHSKSFSLITHKQYLQLKRHTRTARPLPA
jgi:hypothetical protein